MAGFQDYLNSQRPGAAMGGAMAAQSGTSDYGSMVAQLVGNMAQQRMQPQAAAPAQTPGGPSMPDDVARGGPSPMGGGGGGVNPQALLALLGGGGGGAMGGAPQGMDEYSMGRLIGQMLRQRGGM